jgi:hypothetical protein
MIGGRFRALGDRRQLACPRYASTTFIVKTDDPQARIERTVTLGPGAPVSGTVIDPGGHPVAGVTVWIETAGRSWRDPVSSDEHGAWYLDCIAAGKHVVYADGPMFGSSPELVIAHDGVHPKTGLVRRVKQATVFTGHVVDAAGALVSRAFVDFNDGSVYGGTGTDDAGWFTIPDMSGHEYRIAATSETAASPMRRRTTRPSSTRWAGSGSRSSRPARTSCK